MRKTRVVVGYEVAVGSDVTQDGRVVGKIVGVMPVSDQQGNRYALDVELWADVTDGFRLPYGVVASRPTLTSESFESASWTKVSEDEDVTASSRPPEPDSRDRTGT